MFLRSKKYLTNICAFVAVVAILAVCLLGGMPSWSHTVANAADYYSGINASLTGTALRSQVKQLITSTHKKLTTYAGLEDVFKVADADPAKPGNILLFYTGTSVKYSGGFGGQVNREHVWPKNAGKAFPASSGPGSDGHHLRPCDTTLNSTRGSLNYDEVPMTSANIVKENGSSNYGSKPEEYCYKAGSAFMPAASYKGDTARILMYMETRWGDENGLSFVDSLGSNKTMGKISVLMRWHLEDPVDDLERKRNEEVYKIQGNRNPFIDHPEYAAAIYCNDGKSYNNALKQVVAQYGKPAAELESLSLSPSYLSLAVGASATINVIPAPADASALVTWSSANNSVATVIGGVVTGVSVGDTVITATSTTNPSIKKSLSVSVKGISSLSITGTPVKTTYKAGETFSPAGLTVTALYSDSTSDVVNSITQWLDAGTLQPTLSAGTTAVVAKVGNITAVVEGITVEEAPIPASSGALTITINNFTNLGSAYDWNTWSVDGISGEAYLYGGKKTQIQMNSSRTAYSIYNTTALPGNILGVEMELGNDATKNWTVFTAASSFGKVDGKPTSGTNHGTFKFGTDVEMDISGGGRYFCITYADSGAVYIDSITVYYDDGSVAPPACTHTPVSVPGTSATCTQSGLTDGSRCSECGATVIAQREIPALGHTDTDGNGKCDRCGTTVDTTCAHTPVAIPAVAATCTQSGLTAGTRCSKCGETMVAQQTIPALGHADADSNGKCDRCGATATSAACPHADNNTDGVCDICHEPLGTPRVGAFVDAVNGLKDLDAAALLDGIRSALALYDALNPSEKLVADGASGAYDALLEEVARYNHMVTNINQTADNAAKGALQFPLATQAQSYIAHAYCALATKEDE